MPILTTGASQVESVALDGLNETTSGIQIDMISLDLTMDEIKESVNTTNLVLQHSDSKVTQLADYAITSGLVLSTNNATGDAFGRLRVSNNHILFSSQLNYDKLPLLWGERLVGTASSATYNYNTSSCILTAGSGLNDESTRQSKKYLLYRAGQSHTALLSFGNFTTTTGFKKQVGYFDDNDGIFLEASGGTYYIVKRSSVSGSVVDTKIAQANWNLNKLNNSSISPYLNWSAANILVIDLQWLGVGRVRVGFDLNGVIVYAHEFSHAGNLNLADVYMRTASLPCRYGITNTSGTPLTVANMKQICSSVVREGGDELEGYQGSAFTFNTQTATTTPRSAYSIRLKDEYNKATIRPMNITGINNGSARVLIQVILNPTLTGTLVWTSNSTQITEQSITQLNYTAGTGHVLSSYVLSSTTQSKEGVDLGIDNALSLHTDINGNRDIICVIATSATGTQQIDLGFGFMEVY